MINAKKLLEMTPKWQRQSSHGRRQQWKSDPEEVLADLGHFVIYTIDEGRFMIPLAYLNRPIFRELLLTAEEEFGFTRCGPLKVPCEAFVMEYIISLLNRNPPIEVEKALISVTTCRASIPSLALLQTAPDHSIHPSF
ncbi:auxin-responsive protein SAUR36-like [Amborella trichopoda]|uniref:auxin-responsive protein SAUR36-like n=1 Tax=Amborella trichopoda TaxID=13333 RepID=UPI0005D42C74|nr:auxin-responsive protein SAUR36-like [Amborella trichopoda]|eukprot:XP_011621257.1 auxin-responsive protein SAUR36-like [Amborella trichopoda]